ncbi:MBL fold metallo-hydrolase [Desulfomonile tiedjei]|uniref:Zn-dependent hydrolase, glyoxylase n=1 Tax=Desulfomonile tiedjei (strain ATCC 49306 / DSM 6799 / DCB-1) TaxID=706587 RepID=I4C4E0_DESTA|nr:MBL fold metallo-hydrolase [Desulfomonile tiedjei]AFM24431.1 Zn-dependent hydrolase, glyoxylase [Desulfomonile tiedjei DSM 6799]
MTIIHIIQVPIPYPVKWVNCYYFEDSIPTLIDTGLNLPECYESLVEGIRNSGGAASGLRRVVATHGHMDHAGLAGKLRDLSGAEILVHADDQTKLLTDKETIESKIAAFDRILLETGCPEEKRAEALEPLSERFSTFMSHAAECVPLNGGESIQFDDFNLRVLHTPGHSPGSTCLLNEANGDLFSGDSLIDELYVDPSSSMEPLSTHLASLDMLVHLPVRRVYPGHGSSYANFKNRIKRIRQYHDRRTAKVKEILQNSEAPQSPYAIASRLFGVEQGIDLLWAVSSVRFHLERLESIGEAVRISAGNSAYNYVPAVANS